MSESLAIFTENLTKYYGRQIGCREISLAVPAGQVFGFLGPNGAGKSTVVKVLAGLHAPSYGTALLFGRRAGTPAAGRLLGFVPEMFGLPAWPTAADALRFYARISDVPAGEVERRIDEALERVGLPLSVRSKRIGTYSKGMRQRLCIATALLHRPPLLVLDEPTSALDPVGRREVRDLIVSLRREGVTVMLNSHLLSEVEQVADQVAIIRGGRIIRAGSPDDLMTGPLAVALKIEGLTPELAGRLGELGRIEEQVGGTLILHLHRQESVGEIAAVVVRSGARLTQLTPVRQSLESIFLDAVGDSGEEGKSHA